MPIKGLTDRAAKLPQIGILRKGASKPEDGRGPGRDLGDHFRFDTQDAEAAEAFRRSYPEKPNRIRVMLPYASVEENFSTWQEDWSFGSLKHRCDGETCVRSLQSDGTYSTDPVPCPGGCKPSGRLLVVIPELERLACVMVLTTSKHDIIELTSNLEAIQALRGDLRGIPLILSRGKRMVSVPEIDTKTKKPTGKRQRREKWLLSIEAAKDWVQLQLTEMKRAALPGQPPILALPGQDGTSYVDPDTGELFTAPEEDEIEDEPGTMHSSEKAAAIARLHELFDQEHRLAVPEQADWYVDLEACGLGALLNRIVAHEEIVYSTAKQLFYERHSPTIGGDDLRAVSNYLGLNVTPPQSFEDWKRLSDHIKARKALSETAKVEQQVATSKYALSAAAQADIDELEATVTK